MCVVGISQENKDLGLESMKLCHWVSGWKDLGMAPSSAIEVISFLVNLEVCIFQVDDQCITSENLTIILINVNLSVDYISYAQKHY